MQNEPIRAVAFVGSQRIAEGPLAEVAGRILELMATSGPTEPVVVFELETSAVIDLDLRPESLARARTLYEEGSPSHAAAVDPADRRRTGPGRPKLGVVAREVTLLPRHWEWLNDQPGGASVTLRRLVEQARQTTADADRVRKARESAYRFMAVMAGNQPGFEEAIRALFAGDRARFDEQTAEWPPDVAAHARALMAATLA